MKKKWLWILLIPFWIVAIHMIQPCYKMKLTRNKISQPVMLIIVTALIGVTQCFCILADYLCPSVRHVGVCAAQSPVVCRQNVQLAVYYTTTFLAQCAPDDPLISAASWKPFSASFRFSQQGDKSIQHVWFISPSSTLICQLMLNNVLMQHLK